MNFIVSCIGIILAILYLKYNYQITNILGPFPTVEKYLGPGTTYFFHKLIAIIIIVISIMWFFGTFQSTFQSNVGELFVP